MRKEFNVAEHLGQPKKIAKYLNDALATGDIATFNKAIGDIAKAYGVLRLAREIGMDRSNLYRSFDGKTVPRIDTVFKTLAVLKLELLTKAKA